MQDKSVVPEKRHLVASIVSPPGVPFIQEMYENTARKAFFHMWGDAELPDSAAIIVLVEGSGGPVENCFPLMIRCTLSQVEELLAFYKKATKDSTETSGDSPDSAMLLTIGTPPFCQAVTRFWAAERDSLSDWGSRMIAELANAPPGTFVWAAADEDVRTENIMELADAEESAED